MGTLMDNIFIHFLGVFTLSWKLTRRTLEGGGYDTVSEGKAGGVGRNQQGMRGEGLSKIYC